MKKLTCATAILIISFLAVVGILAAFFLIIAIIVQKQFPQYSIWKLFLIYASGNNVDAAFELENVCVLLALSRIFEVITLAIISSYAFSLIINKGVKLVFPDKIVIRRRESEKNKGELALGILIGNPKKYTLYDVECCVNCSYITEKGDINKRNSEVMIVETVKKFQNYYRFSYKITDFHRKFWRDYLDYLNTDTDCTNEDFLCVIISGRSNTLGGTFTIERKYTLSDIGIDLRSPANYIFKKGDTNRFPGKKERQIDWRNFPLFIEADENDRKAVIADIEKYAKPSKKRKKR